MALPGTHIRFALDMAPHRNVEKVGPYLSGTIYPDSRWMTGVAREKTHGKACLKSDFPHSDFTLGWQVHCLCDSLQQPIYERLLADGDPADDKRRWVRHAAAKMVQEMGDLYRFDLGPHLSALDHVETPCGEEARRVRRFNRAIQEAYRSGAGSALEGYRRLWLAIGLAPATTARVMDEAAELLADLPLVKRIGKVYDDILRQALMPVV